MKTNSASWPLEKNTCPVLSDELSVTLARRRVSGNSIGKILQKVLRQVPGFRGKRTGGYFYPRLGYGEITERMRAKAEEAGAAFELDASVLAIEHRDGKVCAVRWQKDGVVHRREADAVWSTLPITTLVRLLEPAAPPEILAAAGRIRFRGLILIYLVVEQDRFTEYDAHYFPELAVPIARRTSSDCVATLKPREASTPTSRPLSFKNGWVKR